MGGKVRTGESPKKPIAAITTLISRSPKKQTNFSWRKSAICWQNELCRRSRRRKSLCCRSSRRISISRTKSGSSRRIFKRFHSFLLCTLIAHCSLPIFFSFSFFQRDEEKSKSMSLIPRLIELIRKLQTELAEERKRRELESEFDALHLQATRQS